MPALCSRLNAVASIFSAAAALPFVSLLPCSCHIATAKPSDVPFAILGRTEHTTVPLLDTG